MLILGKDQLKDPSLGYARTFVKQVEDCIELALERGVKIVSNAGGLNPAGLAEKLPGPRRQGRVRRRRQPGRPRRRAGARQAADRQRLPRCLRHRGGALQRGADIVVTGRVTDASVVVGPAIAHYGWGPRRLRRLAGAVVAGHVIECGTQATGGNFSGFRELCGQAASTSAAGLPDRGDRVRRVVRDHQARRAPGARSPSTPSPRSWSTRCSPTRYLGPDVTTRLDTIQLTQEAPTASAIAGVPARPPPATPRSASTCSAASATRPSSC